MNGPREFSTRPCTPDFDAPFALRSGEPVSRGQLWSQVRALAQRLPERPHVFNLCEDRYLFCLTVLAAMFRRQVCLLPPSGQPGVVAEILREYPDAYLASERRPDGLPCPWFGVEAPAEQDAAAAPDFDHGQTALIVFTSGSTGYPKPCPHTFGTFSRSAGMALHSLDLQHRRLLVVSTTPPQHMYGLETSIFWPLFSDLVMYPGRPFFPEDIRRLVADAPLPVLLVSTPIHLRSIAMTAGPWNNLAGILSSTAPLSEGLAKDMERVTGTPVREIYGSTETLSFASRSTARETHWQLYAGASLIREGDGQTRLISPHLSGPAQLSDAICIGKDGSFQVLGRSVDMVKIGGKRVSLAEMNRRLTDINGIEDGLFYVFNDGRGEARMAALVVSSLDRQAIRKALRAFLDDVFLPKIIHFVTEIPRDRVGKVAKANLDRLLAGLAGQGRER